MKSNANHQSRISGCKFIFLMILATISLFAFIQSPDNRISTEELYNYTVSLPGFENIWIDDADADQVTTTSQEHHCYRVMTKYKHLHQNRYRLNNVLPPKKNEIFIVRIRSNPPEVIHSITSKPFFRSTPVRAGPLC